MSANNTKIPVDFPVVVLGKWKETYQWIPKFGAFAAITLAFAAGANNLPAPFSTPIGSGVLTLLKASIMAIMIYVPGAAFASSSTVNALFSDFLQEHQPNEGFLMWSLVVVLITASIWLVLATYFELPVSSQQSTQGALLGTMLVTEGFGFLPMWNKNANHDFNGGGLLWIFLEWTVAPLIAFIFAYCLFALLKASLLCHENAEKRILIFLPISYGISAGLLCLFLMYQVISDLIPLDKLTTAIAVAVAIATLIGAVLSLVVVVPLARKRFDATQNFKTIKKNKSMNHQSTESQNQKIDSTIDSSEHFEETWRDFMQMRVLDTVYEEDERSWISHETTSDSELAKSVSTGQSTPFKQLLESTPNRLVQTRNFQKIKKTTASENVFKFIQEITKATFFPAIKYDNRTLIRHALAEKFDDEIEEFFGFPQLLASCIFALIQSASEIAAVVSPYGAIVDVCEHRAQYSGNGEDVGSINVTWWFRAISGLVASLGFLLYGWRLTQCLGGKLTYISNSRGLASQLSAVATMILVTRLDLPVSSTHAFVGSLIGVGIADNPRNVNWKLLFKFLCGWVLTILFCCGVGYGLFSFSIHSPAYVVP